MSSISGAGSVILVVSRRALKKEGIGLKGSNRNNRIRSVAAGPLRTVFCGAVLAVLLGVITWQQAEAEAPAAGKDSQNTNQVAFATPPLPPGARINDSRDGSKRKWCFLPKDWEIKGHLFIGGGSWSMGFYPNGELESGGLVHVEVIDGIPCREASRGPRGWISSNPRTYFYEDGRLKSAEVAVTFRYRGQIIEKGKRIVLRPDGSIESIKARSSGIQ